MPRSVDMDSDDEYYRKKKMKKSKSKDYDRDRDDSRDRDRGKDKSKHKDRDRDYEKDRDKEKKHKEKKHKDKSEKKSKSEKSPVSDLTPAEKFSIFKKQREAGKKEDTVVDDMFKDFIAAKLKEIETDTPNIPDKDSKETVSSVEEMKKFLDSELNSLASPTKQMPKQELTSKPNVDETVVVPANDKSTLPNMDLEIKEKNISIKAASDIKTEPDTGAFDTFPGSKLIPKPINKPFPVFGPVLPKSLALKEEIQDDPPTVKQEPQISSEADSKKKETENKKPMLGFKNFGIKLSLTSTELIQSGAIHKKGKRLEDGEVLSSSDSENSKSSDTEPEVEEDGDDNNENEISETGSINDTDDETKSKKKKKKKKKGKHKKKKNKDQDRDKVKEEDPLGEGQDKTGEKRKVSQGSRSRSRSPKKSKQTVSSSKEKSKRSKSRERSKRSKSKDRSKRSRSKEKSKISGSKDRSKRSRSRSNSRSRKRRSRSRSKGRRSTSRSRRRSKEKSSRRSRSRDRKRSRSRSPIKSWRSSRYGDFDAYRFSNRKARSRSKTPDRESEKLKEKERKRLEDLRLKIDKAKLREIAMKNALTAARTGGVQLDVTIKAGGKSVEELTQYCKRIQDAEKAKRLARGEEVSSEEEIDPNPDSDEGNMHHPFKMREPSAIVMDIQNAKQLPIATPQERLAQSGQLRLQFPVSSGSQHREKEWVPVEKPEPVSRAGFGTSQPSLFPAIEDKVFEEPKPMNVDISSIVSERLNAVRKLQENPHDIIAKEILSQAQHKASQWAQSKNLPGQFLGSTGANIMSPEEIMGNKKKQAWIKKDVFTSAAPVTSGIGMFLLQKMGWKMGEGLGKNNEGQREPLMLDFKVDRKGLVTTGEGKKPQMVPKVPRAPIARDLSGKHPVSALGEVCNRRKWGAPRYEILHESGPSHKKDFVFKVRVNGYEYQPSVSSNSKKLAKAAAATVCLQELGLIPRDPT